MREMPLWTRELLVTPPMELISKIFLEGDNEEGVAALFRVHLLSEYVAVRHQNPDTIRDPLLRLMVRLSDQTKFVTLSDDLLWTSLFAVLKESSPQTFAAWVNFHHEGFRWGRDFQEITEWVYEDTNGQMVDRFPYLDAAMADINSMAERLKSQGAKPSPRDSSGTGKQGGCYVATAVYGSYEAEPVLTLRRYRDEKLLTTALGRAFVHCYYAASPQLVRHFAHVKALRRLIKLMLDRLVRHLDNSGYGNPALIFLPGYRGQ